MRKIALSKQIRRGKDEYDSWPRNGTSRKWESIHLGGHTSGNFGGVENETNCFKQADQERNR